MSSLKVPFALLLAGTLLSASSYAADSHKDVARHGQHARHLRDLLQPVDGGRPGVLVAPTCTTCREQTKPESVMDWIKALLRGFPPTPV